MDFITKNTGLQHISEKIFMNLDYEDLMICGEVNQSWKQILKNNPIFWLQKCFLDMDIDEDESSEYFKLKWNMLIQASNSNQKEKIARHLLEIYHCFSHEGSIDFIDLIEKIKHSKDYQFLHQIMKLNIYTSTEITEEIHDAATDGDLEALQILAQYSDDPNAPDTHGTSLIYKAADKGWTEVVKIIAPLSENPNPIDPHDETPPLELAIIGGHTEIVRILAPICDNPNAPSSIDGFTSIQMAAEEGFCEIIKILAPLSNNPNAPNPNGWTPVQHAAMKGYDDIV